ncbi:hypothetical protein [Sulfurimonas sp. HSL3-7]|uniref:caspase family protein n=1 Tax=Sulfonitrofixus jiaomeiensis TaxID=3131938 RepID=UPI0031F845D3
MQKLLVLLAISWVSLLAEENLIQNYVPLDISAVHLGSMDAFASTEKIAVPELSSLKAFQKKSGESEAAFLKRVRNATQKRQQATFDIQKSYRDEVLQRNNSANSSKEEFERQVRKHNQKLQKLRTFLDYDAKVHGAASVSQEYPQLIDVSTVFDTTLQNPNLNDPFLPLLTSYSDKTYNAKDDELARLIKRTKKSYPDYKSWLFVVSIENYANADSVLFASRTAKAVVSTFQKKMGVPLRHTIVVENEKATAANILAALEKMINRIQQEDTVYFYFVGHAMSGPSGKNFLLAYDGSVDMLDDDGLVGMERIYNAFQRCRAERTFAFIDASFMGVSDGIPLKKGERLSGPVKKTKYHKRLNIINAANRDQTANGYFEKGYRLFSYFLIKGALSEKEQDAGEMFDDLQLKMLQVSTTYGPEFTQEPEFFGYRNLAMQK